MQIVLVEPYYGGSHKAWADGYIAKSSHDVHLVSHDARFWKWRMHGGFLTLAAGVAELVESGIQPDVILASSMMDVAAFAGAVRNTVPGVPIATYFHESQFTYPLSPSDKVDHTYQMKNWASAAVSDTVIFNSEYHRSVFAGEAASFLRTFPDQRHTDLVGDVIDRSLVLPVGVDLTPVAGDPLPRTSPQLILWNHRWEHDKGPMELRAIVGHLLDADIEFSMAMCGEVFGSVPPLFAEITEMLGSHLMHAGFAERNRYIELLRTASVVLSTADQEFFGIGVVEAIAAGAHPVLPDRLVYPERIAALGASPATALYQTPDEAADLVMRNLPRDPDDAVRSAAQQYDWSTVATAYDRALEALADRAFDV